MFLTGPELNRGEGRAFVPRLALAIKRARYLALLPYTPDHISPKRVAETKVAVSGKEPSA
jgi:hypothetical protein